MSYLDTIKKAALTLPFKSVFIEAWNKEVFVQTLTLGERRKFFELLSDEDQKINIASMLVALSLLDDDKQKLHKSCDLNELYQSLENGDHNIVETLYRLCDELSLVTNDAVESAEKN